MTFYKFGLITNTQGALIDVKNTENRLFSSFIPNDGDHKFLQFNLRETYSFFIITRILKINILL